MKEKTKSKSNSLKRSLKILKGGEDVQPKEETKSSFFDFLNKRDIKKRTIAIIKWSRHRKRQRC